jgi:hypothetical protein
LLSISVESEVRLALEPVVVATAIVEAEVRIGSSPVFEGPNEMSHASGFTGAGA